MSDERPEPRYRPLINAPGPTSNVFEQLSEAELARLERNGQAARRLAQQPGHTQPIHLIALDEPHPGTISAIRFGEPELTHVQSVADALAAAQLRGVDLRVPEDIFTRLRSDFPRELPPFVKVDPR